MGLKFRIPSYQRGYRWERKQVEQLLDDLREFEENLGHAKELDYENENWNREHPDNPQKPIRNEANMGYYCLQPLAVAPTLTDGTYDVIDGQQRLTTIYLILYWLSTQSDSLPYNQNRKISESLYELTYQSRKDDFFIGRKFVSCDDSATSNIDYYFMSRAYETVGEWFEKNSHSSAAIRKMLLPDDYWENDDKRKRNARLHDVRFIWYDTPQESSITIFNNLNYGKIGLTASELVKALLFQCDVYDAGSKEVARKEAFARSTKWSLMEESLQDEYFWGMLTGGSTDDDDLHLELILRFVAKNIDSAMGYSRREGWRDSDSDWVFCVFNKAVSDESLGSAIGRPLCGMMDRIAYLWEEIQKVYNVLHNWYSNRELYHKIGLLVHLNTTYGKKSRLEVIRVLYDEYRKRSKPEFEECLRTRIGDSVAVQSEVTIDTVSADGTISPVKRRKKLSELNYEEDPNDIRRILLLFNVAVLMDNSSEEARFPFKEACMLKSLEHIHPQHLDEDGIEYPDFKEWFESRRKILKDRGVVKMDMSSATEQGKGLADAISSLDKYLSSNDDFNSHKQLCLEALSVVDKCFDELAGMKPEVLHSLRNMALVDAPTNSALGNKLMDAKRAVLKSRSGESYIPLGTWYAFNKYYSGEVSDLKFWREADRDAYFAEIEKIYNSYTSENA